ncbi:hypothetical protein CDD80_6588 [Ophiocordyceps camponoti-rufipedis]|uniref:Transcription elongation factor 1 homolog n=1 Tax=Ophiocordyceps camponoti-rufipedis TaxID=2004952 RepID=A0A2C5ZC66_9HYPO|nr:hypothetical protein CDD80_6588 [Ophiocordyceps camponoti-rufipedis]
MGKRKKSSRKPMGPKRVCHEHPILEFDTEVNSQTDPLPTMFTCLFCNHEKSVTVKLDRKAGVGQLDCRICGQKFQCAVNYAVAKQDTTETRMYEHTAPSSSNEQRQRGLRDTDGDVDQDRRSE